MTRKSAKEELADIYDSIIPKDGSNIVEDDEEDNNGYTFAQSGIGVTFDERAAEVQAQLQKAPPVIAIPYTPPAPEPIKPKVVEPVAGPLLAKPVEAPRKQPTVDVEELLSDTIVKPVVAPKVVEPEISFGSEGSESSHESVEEESCEEVKSEEKVVDKSGVEVATGSTKDSGANTVDDSTITGLGGIDATEDEEESFWQLKAPSVASESFYRDKKRRLAKMLIGGELPFSRFDTELREAFIDMPEGEFNPEEILETMREVQTHKNRVEKIRLDALNQYFVWKRTIEIYRGLAAKLEGAKGAAVDGAAGKHLMDFEFYWSKLQALVEKTEGIRKNLDAAYENLSRQVSLCMPNQAMERIERPYEQKRANSFSSTPSNSASESNLSGFDKLEVSTTSTRTRKKADDGSVWGSI